MTKFPTEYTVSVQVPAKVLVIQAIKRRLHHTNLGANATTQEGEGFQPFVGRFAIICYLNYINFFLRPVT